MEYLVHFLNYFTKLLYGCHLALAFSGVTFRQNQKNYGFIMILVIFLQNLSYFTLGEEMTIQIYPFLIHIPIIFCLTKRVKVPLLHSAFGLILAFQLLSCRTWSGVLLGYFLGGSQMAEEFATTLLTFPLALLFSSYLAPPIARLKEEPKIMVLLSVAPISYYVFSYIFTIYDVISLGNNQLLLHFMEAWFVLAFVIYSLFSFFIFEEKKRHEVERAVLVSMQNHAKTELKQLHRQQEIEQMHRHDMRHHGNYLLSLLPEDTENSVKEYIQSVFISPKLSQALLSNDASLNLVLNLYQKESEKKGFSLDFSLNVDNYSGFAMVDLCSLLSNGLENAIKATSGLPEEERKISLKMKSQGETLVIDLRNSFYEEPVFFGDLPYTSHKKHGYGTKSMLQICQKYHGITRFCVVEKEFRFQTVLQNQGEVREPGPDR